MPDKDYVDKSNGSLAEYQKRNIAMSRRMAAKRKAAKKTKATETRVPNAKRPGLFSLPGMLKRAAGLVGGGKALSKGRSKGSRDSESSVERSKSSGRTKRR